MNQKNGRRAGANRSTPEEVTMAKGIVALIMPRVHGKGKPGQLEALADLAALASLSQETRLERVKTQSGAMAEVELAPGELYLTRRFLEARYGWTERQARGFLWDCVNLGILTESGPGVAKVFSFVPQACPASMSRKRVPQGHEVSGNGISSLPLFDREACPATMSRNDVPQACPAPLDGDDNSLKNQGFEASDKLFDEGFDGAAEEPGSSEGVPQRCPARMSRNDVPQDGAVNSPDSGAYEEETDSVVPQAGPAQMSRTDVPNNRYRRKKKTERASWRPSAEFEEVASKYRDALPPTERVTYFPSREDEVIYFKTRAEITAGLGGDTVAAHELILKACEGWKFDPWPERKQPSAHRFAVVVGRVENVRRFAAFTAEIDDLSGFLTPEELAAADAAETAR